MRFNCENVEKTLGLPHSAILAVCFSGQQRGPATPGRIADQQKRMPPAFAVQHLIEMFTENGR